MFLNRITLLDIKDKKLLYHVLNQDSEYTKMTKSLKTQTEKLVESAEFKQLASYIKDQYDEFLKEEKGNDREEDFDLEELDDQYSYSQEEEETGKIDYHQNEKNQESIDLSDFDADSIDKYRVNE
ncbi:MAG: hypothetical protein HeimC3_30310 [Candidatus Heimdallarchaeota archaeon LC_3]|nr:MAG: hypothetical protein HeimC3_30310 [Candidatus Heimdallarchaeota archaeon LC_3]